ncbi:hypothetical protein [Duganella levis]|uniref:Lipoprotein n=1 Tax=Duganella levis TaxID=2692169 RepID=A0ABW9VT50_9BURK|nr:hypothetical protein [Duganella levis]MYN24797.1 hypothetical protein [Duganella levis]
MRRKDLVIPLLLAAVSVGACNSEKKGNLDSKKNGMESFVFKPPRPSNAASAAHPAPKPNPDSSAANPIKQDQPK